MAAHKIKAEKRDIFGKSLGKLRKGGQLPAVLYGPKEKNQPIFVNLPEFKKIWNEAGESTLIKLELRDISTGVATDKDVLINHIDIDPLKNEPRHVDFYAVDMTKKTTVAVPIEFVGTAPAVKNLGGVLVKVIHEVEVEALPKDLPHAVIVDIGSLKTLEDRITISDLPVLPDVEIKGNPEEVVILVEEPKEEAVETEAPSLEEIEVVGEKKEEEAGAKEDEGGNKSKE